GRAAVAEEHLVALRDAEEIGEAGAHPADEVLDGRLPVRGAEEPRVRLQVRELLGPDLRGSAAETAVGGEEVARNIDGRHRLILPRRYSWSRRAQWRSARDRSR